MTKKKCNLNLLKNKRYHLNERVKFLKVLSNSTSFAKCLLNPCGLENEEYISMVTNINRLYNSFDNFSNDWMLDYYDDLKEDMKKKHQIHDSFKYYIQYIFGIGEYYMVKKRDKKKGIHDC